MKLAEPFASGFDATNLTLFASDHWTVLVRKVQVTLGALVLAANRCFVSASELTQPEVSEFPIVVGRLEAVLKSAFQYDKINYLCLMMVDQHYHFHVLPRYASPRTFSGRSWHDASWPKPPNLAGEPSDTALLVELRDQLRKHLPRG